MRFNAYFQSLLVFITIFNINVSLRILLNGLEAEDGTVGVELLCFKMKGMKVRVYFD